LQCQARFAAFLGGSASRLLLAKVVLTLLKTLPKATISCLEIRVQFAPQESAICPDVGLFANGTW
jgi:hypothetical protein